MVYMYHSFLVHSSADGHLGCFNVLAMTNSAAMNIGVHVSLSDLVSAILKWKSDFRPPELKFQIVTLGFLHKMQFFFLKALF